MKYGFNILYILCIHWVYGPVLGSRMYCLDLSPLKSKYLREVPAEYLNFPCTGIRHCQVLIYKYILSSCI